MRAPNGNGAAKNRRENKRYAYRPCRPAHSPFVLGWPVGRTLLSSVVLVSHTGDTNWPRKSEGVAGAVDLPRCTPPVSTARLRDSLAPSPSITHIVSRARGTAGAA
eukprot:5955728-Prymnesium_polylepis.1